LIFAVVLILATRRYRHFLIPPGVILGSILLFYLVLWITGTPNATAVEQGWLLGTVPEQGLWPPLDYSAITQINVAALVTQTGNLAVVVIVAVVGILLNITGIEIVTGQTIDLNRELKAAGLGNVVSGLGGGGAGYHTLGSSTLAYKMGARTRLVAVLMVIFALVILLLGGRFLSYFPNLVLGGLLIFLGLDFLAEWVYEAWFKLSKADYGIIILILVTMNTVGVLEGVGLGIFLAVVLFVINYSRIDVVKHAFSGTTYHTRVDRAPLYQQLLHSKDHWLYILELQGFIFFGTANKLFEQIQQRLTAPASALPRFIILDFRRVSGLDSSAVFSFTKIKQLIRSKKVVLILTDLSPDMAHQLKGVLDDGSIRQFSNLSYGVEWCENEMIRIYREVGLATKPKTLVQQLEAFWREQRLDEEEAETAVDLMDYLRPADPHPGSEKIIELMTYWQKMEVETGHYLTRQGDPAQTLYFIEQGRATVEIEAEGGKKLPLRILEAGAVVGEVSIYRQQVASASVVATQPCTVYSLSLDDLKRIEKESPEAALILHKFLAPLVSERLASLNNTLQAL
jgi:SulP family sulfate permease